jgi:hypothetical protein
MHRYVQLWDVQKAARTIGQRVLILRASTDRELETAFARRKPEEPSRLKRSEMVQYGPRHAHGGIRIFSVEQVQINADRQGQHYDQHAEHDPIMVQTSLRNLRPAILIFLKCV